MPISQKQLEANRRNAMKSTGPRTIAGKLVSSQNSVIHGLCANKVLLPNENHHDLKTFSDAFIDDLQPEGPLEIFLAHRIVSAAWRLRRAVELESMTLVVLESQHHRRTCPKPQQTRSGEASRTPLPSQG